MGKYDHLGEHVGDSDVCMDCRNELAAFTTGWQLCEPCRKKRADQWAADLVDPNEAPLPQVQTHLIAIKKLVDGNLWTLQEYIDWINRPEEGVIKGELMAAPDWAEYQITKASELGEYLDECVERERRKDGMGMSKFAIIKEVSTEGIGKKMLVRHSNGTYELMCAWSGGAGIYLTPEELKEFGAAMIEEAGFEYFRA